MRTTIHRPACNGLCSADGHHLYPGDTLWRTDPEEDTDGQC